MAEHTANCKRKVEEELVGPRALLDAVDGLSSDAAKAVATATLALHQDAVENTRGVFKKARNAAD